MPSPSDKIRKMVGTASCGTPPQQKELTGVETATFKLHNFVDLEETTAVRSHGHDWKLPVFERGSDSSSEDNECVCVYL